MVGARFKSRCRDRSGLNCTPMQTPAALCKLLQRRSSRIIQEAWEPRNVSPPARRKTCGLRVTSGDEERPGRSGLPTSVPWLNQ